MSFGPDSNMRFTETPLKGAFVVEVEAQTDARGSFARTFCAREFAESGFGGELSCNATCRGIDAPGDVARHALPTGSVVAR